MSDEYVKQHGSDTAKHYTNGLPIEQYRQSGAIAPALGSGPAVKRETPPPSEPVAAPQK